MNTRDLIICLVVIAGAFAAVIFLSGGVDTSKKPSASAAKSDPAAPPIRAEPKLEIAKTTAEQRDWEAIRNSKNIHDYETFLAFHPDGEFAHEARTAVRALESIRKIVPIEKVSTPVNRPSMDAKIVAAWLQDIRMQTSAARLAALGSLQKHFSIDPKTRTIPPPVLDDVHTTLLDAYRDNNVEIRLAVVGTFAAIAANETLSKDELARVVGGMAGALSDPDSKIRAAAMRSLGTLGPRAESALPNLIAMVKGILTGASKDLEMAEVAVTSLGVIGRENAAVVPTLIDALKQPRPLTDVSVDGAAKTLDARAKDALVSVGAAAVPSLLPELKGSHAIPVMSILASIGPKAKAAAPPLRSIIFDRSNPPHDRVVAARALWRVTTETSETLNIFIEGLADAEARSTAIAYLEEMGPAARNAVSALQALLGRNDVSQSAVERALKKINAAAP